MTISSLYIGSLSFASVGKQGQSELLGAKAAAQQKAEFIEKWVRWSQLDPPAMMA
jgi:hypothetical protein